MNLQKSKEIIDLNIKEAGKKMPPDVKNALTLGSESIDAILKWREDYDDNLLLNLPSETKD